jgi:hypothetical protein
MRANRARSRGEVMTLKVSDHGVNSLKFQTPLDLVVKFQPIDIVGFIL